MSKSRILLVSNGIMCLLLTVTLIYFVHGAVTLIEENKILKVENTKIKRDNIHLNSRTGDLRDKIDSLNKNTELLNKDRDLLKQRIEQQNSINRKLLEDNTKLKQIIGEGSHNPSLVPSRGQSVRHKEIYVIATAYVAFCDTGCTGVTATGIDLVKNPNAKVVSVDPRIIPLGSKVYIEGYGYAIAGDTGGAIKGYHVDLLVPNRHTAVKWGVKRVKVTILN